MSLFKAPQFILTCPVFQKSDFRKFSNATYYYFCSIKHKMTFSPYQVVAESWQARMPQKVASFGGMKRCIIASPSIYMYILKPHEGNKTNQKAAQCTIYAHTP